MSVERRGVKASPNKVLQLTAENWGFMNVCGLLMVLVCRTVFGEPLPQLNLGRVLIEVLTNFRY